MVHAPSPPCADVTEAAAARILAAADPDAALLRLLEELDARQDLEAARRVFERLSWRVGLSNFWVLQRMTAVYCDLRLPAQAFQVACWAILRHPVVRAAFECYREAYRYLRDRGEVVAAVDLFLRHLAWWPERAIAAPDEIEPLLKAAGRPSLHVPPAPQPPARHVHRVAAAETRAAMPVRAAGTALPYCMAPLAQLMPRRAVAVVAFHDAELLVCNDAAVVRSAEGHLYPGFSIGDFPGAVAEKVLRAEAAGTAERHETEDAVVILDGFATANLCHLLLDQITRLALYRRAGVDIARALVVGPAAVAAFQREIVARAGVARLLGTDRIARVRAARLWVSTSCKGLQHPAHLGADWTIAEAQRVLGGQGTTGTRRLYLSREDATVRRVTNEAALWAALQARGFERLVPGAMSYQEQVEAFRSASHIVAPHGAALAHLVVCPPGARVLELFHPLYGTAAYAIVAQAAGLDYAAHVGRDGASDAPELNEVRPDDLPDSRYGKRHIRAEIGAVLDWVEGVPSPALRVLAHVHDEGDVAEESGGWVGAARGKRWLEGFAVTPLVGVPAEALECRAVDVAGGDSSWQPAGTFCGSRGRALPLRAVAVRLVDAAAARFVCRVAVRGLDGAAGAPVEDGALCAAPDGGPLAALRVELFRRA